MFIVTEYAALMSTQNGITCSFCFNLHRSVLNERINTFCADRRLTFFSFHFAAASIVWSVLNDKYVYTR